MLLLAICHSRGFVEPLAKGALDTPQRGSCLAVAMDDSPAESGCETNLMKDHQWLTR